ncbi:MAG: helix-turn-helix transcriptional regulator [Myxococcales bacterium]|nr:helix-turn-helix transcriptional regulator [Myxococcales bacterium]MCB9732553.1 helix-turn-helix transcriptional regulator [Deltaproteobacteria bacterium]
MDENRLSKMFKALSNPNRLRLFEQIRQGGDEGAVPADARPSRGVGGCLLQHVIDALDVGAPTVSHHLKELVNAGLIETEKHGKQLRCRVAPAALGELARYFGGASGR